MIVKQKVENFNKDKDLTFGEFQLTAWIDEVRIIREALKLYIDYSPRRAKDRPTYEEKRSAMEMVEAIRHPYQIDADEWEDKR